jgi:tripartite-type tricarboxylate transporter receptor subunit TctC
MKRRILLGAGLALPALAAHAQEIPGRTVTLVVPFAPGTVIDIMARAFAEPFRQALGGGATVVVANRDGAGGSIAGSFVAQSRPDGTVIGFGPSGGLTVQPILVPTLTYRLDAFEPVCQTFENIFALAASPQAPFANLAALVEAARARPETISFGHAGNGTTGHRVIRQFELLAGIRLNEVGYRGGGQMLTDAQAGTIPLVVTTWATLRNSGLRVLAIASDARDPAIGAEVPTFRELGFDLTLRGFGGLWAPRGLPPELARRLEAACLEATRSEAYGTVMRNAAQVVAPLGAQDFTARLVAEQAEARTLLDRLGLVPR